MTAEEPAGKLKVAARSALMLGVFALLGAGLVALTYEFTYKRIADNQQRTLQRQLHEILPADAYDNALDEDTLQVTTLMLGGSDQHAKVYRARKDGQPVAVIMEVTAPDGYSGAIRLLVGVTFEGKLAGVRVVSHRETPGLGDDLELARSDWILEFDGRSLGEPPLEDWAVRRDGGVFDQFTGATITPRAVVKAVRNALLYFRDQREQLFAEPVTNP